MNQRSAIRMVGINLLSLVILLLASDSVRAYFGSPYGGYSLPYNNFGGYNSLGYGWNQPYGYGYGWNQPYAYSYNSWNQPYGYGYGWNQPLSYDNNLNPFTPSTSYYPVYSPLSLSDDPYSSFLRYWNVRYY